MDAAALIESRLTAAVKRGASAECPPKLAAAIRHAVFPGGARVRPQLCLAVAAACGAKDFGVAASAGAAIELFHCASLVHDDLPCFDAADMRRGRPSVQSQFGEALAVLAGDALIVLGFETLALGCAAAPDRLAPLFSVIAASVGAPRGIVAGQAWESEETVNLRQYQRAKTGALFVAASMTGAIACKAEPAPWRTLGDRMGEAYQVADDIRDVAESSDETGKPAGQDAAHGRPNTARELGLNGALDLLESLLADAAASIPDCAGADNLRALVRQQAARLTPKHLARNVA
ncbi:MAG: polyprenyl synthetase family protein [Parvularculaceae bacterium]